MTMPYNCVYQSINLEALMKGELSWQPTVFVGDSERTVNSFNFLEHVAKKHWFVQ